MHAGREGDFPACSLSHLLKFVGVSFHGHSGKVERKHQLTLRCHGPLSIKVVVASEDLVNQLESLVLFQAPWLFGGGSDRLVRDDPIKVVVFGVTGIRLVQLSLNDVELGLRKRAAKPERGQVGGGVKAGGVGMAEQMLAQDFRIERCVGSDALLSHF